MVIGAAGSFAAVSTLLGSPLLGAFLLMEVVRLAGPMIGVVLPAGPAGGGDRLARLPRPQRLTGLGHVLARPFPTFRRSSQPTVAEFGWAIAIGVLAAVLGTG